MDDNLLYPNTLISELQSQLSRRSSVTLDCAPKFIFLCGQQIDCSNGGNRKVVREFLKKVRKDIFCLYAEDLFTSKHSNEIDLLTYEHYLAELSDGIILFVESFGTACEFGAFSMFESLGKKLYVINDIKYVNTSSFINDGPIKKLKKKYPENVMFTDTETLLSNSTIDTKLRNIALTKNCIINRNADSINLKSFIIEVLEIIFIFGPISQTSLLYVYKKLKQFSEFRFRDDTNYLIKNIPISYILELLVRAGLVIDKDGFYIINSNRYDYCNLMFKSSVKNRIDVVRAIALSRKFRYKEGITGCL